MCLDVLRGLLCWLQLFPQCRHKYPQRSHIVIPTAAPDILCEKGMGQYLADILGQQAQQLILHGCQVKFVFIQISASPGIIHFQVTISVVIRASLRCVTLSRANNSSTEKGFVR